MGINRHTAVAVVAALLSVCCALAYGDEDQILRMDTSFNMRIGSDDSADSADSADPAFRCMASTLVLNDREKIISTSKRRILCETPIGPLGFFFRAELGTTGISKTLLVDIDTGSWLEVTDKPDIDPRKPDEDKWTWEARLNEIRDHVVTIESSTRIFDPFDAEVTEQAREVLWNDLKESDPKIATVVGFLVENLGGCKSPYCMGLVHSVTDWVFAGQPPVSSQVNVQMLGVPSIGDPDEHELTDFEKGFGKWGRSFPDPPRLD
jgi:hypothetical protein